MVNVLGFEGSRVVGSNFKVPGFRVCVVQGLRA